MITNANIMRVEKLDDETEQKLQLIQEEIGELYYKMSKDTDPHYRKVTLQKINDLFKSMEKLVFPERKAIIKLEVTQCEDCKFHQSRKVYTADSFENVRAIHCTQLGQDVHSYLDWNEKSTIPKNCPFVL